MSKKKQKSTFKVIRKIIRDNVWVGRDDEVHGISATADIIDREVVELAYQEGFINAQDPGEGFVRVHITTRHPENYLLINLHDSTFWGLIDGRWKKAKELRYEKEDGSIDVFDLRDLQRKLKEATVVEDAPVEDAPRPVEDAPPEDEAKSA